MSLVKDKFYNELRYYQNGHKDLESMFELALDYINYLENDLTSVDDFEAIDTIEANLEQLRALTL